jgi:hypothetical protein
MISWQPPGGDGSGADASRAHPDFDAASGTYKREFWTCEKYNHYAESHGWNSRCYSELQFETPQLNQLRDTWFEIAEKKKGPPSRADFDARTLKPFLTNISLVDCVTQKKGRSRYRFRLVGSELTRLFGDQTGRYADEFFPPASLPRWVMAYDIVIDTGRPMRFTSRFILPLISHLDGESFSAPLVSEGKHGWGLLTALYVKPRAGVVSTD